MPFDSDPGSYIVIKISRIRKKVRAISDPDVFLSQLKIILLYSCQAPKGVCRSVRREKLKYISRLKA